MEGGIRADNDPYCCVKKLHKTVTYFENPWRDFWHPIVIRSSNVWSSFYVYITLCLKCAPVSLARYEKCTSRLEGNYEGSNFWASNFFQTVNTPKSCIIECQKSRQGFLCYVTALWDIFTQHLTCQETFCKDHLATWHSVDVNLGSIFSQHLYFECIEMTECNKSSVN